MDKYNNVFIEEAYELLAELETSLLALEETPDDMELIGRIFRAMHTIKGSGAMFGFDNIAAFTHNIETVFDLIRNGEIKVTKKLINLTLSACDQIRLMLDGADDNDTAGNEEKTETIITAFGELIPKEKKQDSSSTESNSCSIDPNGESGAKNVTYWIRFRPAADIFAYGNNPILLLTEIRELGECLILAQTSEIPELDDIDPETCYTYWDVILTTTHGLEAIKDVFIFVIDDCELKIEIIDEAEILNTESDYKKLGEILVERGDLTKEAVQKVLEAQKPIGELLVNAGVVDSDKVQSALTEQQHVRKIRKKRQVEKSASSIRVPSEKLDKLMNLVGELVIVQARLSQTTFSKNDPELLPIAEEVERLSGELRENTMSIRMLPIGTIFSKFKRLVRDLSNDQGKDIALTTEGAETELDKTVIERLNDPLVHLIRNSIDHGIETPEVREAAGKSRQGTIQLSAAHSGGNVLIQIKDDGSGLNAEAIRTKAVEKGLLQPDAKLPEEEIFRLIFAPGFSTANKVTNVSGRGVGMDVVKRNIEALRGFIDISSKKGIGTTITLKLPLTLGIIEGLLVNIEENYFVLPLSEVEECVELTRQDIVKAHGNHIAHVRGEIVPYIQLRDKFMIDGNSPDIEQIVIVRENDKKIGFLVDEIIGQYQTVIKSLGRMYKGVAGISGATILGDGTVALILDIQKLVQMAEMEEEKELEAIEAV